MGESERNSDHSVCTRIFGDAIDMLNDYLIDEPDSPHKSYVENVKVTYTRRLLEALASLSGAGQYRKCGQD